MSEQHNSTGGEGRRSSQTLSFSPHLPVRVRRGPFEGIFFFFPSRRRRFAKKEKVIIISSSFFLPSMGREWSVKMKKVAEEEKEGKKVIDS